MNLEQFLLFHRVPQALFVELAAAFLAEKGCSAALLSGSLAEGLGNIRSDVDIYVIGDVPEGLQLSFGSALISAIEGIPVDIEFVPPEVVAELSSRLAQLPSDEVRDLRQSAAAFSSGELKLLHNLRISRLLFRDNDTPEPLLRIDGRSLARINFDVANVYLDLLHEDTLGFLESGEVESARALLRAYRTRLAGALLAALGETNPAEKWHSQLLRQMSSRIGDLDLPGGMTGAEFLSCLALSDRSLGDSPVEVELRKLLKLANTLLPWAMERFLSSVPLESVAKSAERMRQTGFRQTPSRPLPSLTADSKIRRDGRGIWLGRMGRPRQIYLNTLGHGLVLHFDGVSTTSDVLASISRPPEVSDDELIGCIGDFEAALKQFSFVD